MIREYDIVKSILKLNKKIFIITFTIYLISTLFLLFNGLFLKGVFDNLEVKNINAVWFYIFIFLISLIIRIYFVKLYSKWQAKFQLELQENLYNQLTYELLTKTYADELSKNPNEILNMYRNDLSQIVEYIESYYIEFHSLFLFSIMTIFTLGNINKNLLLYSFIPLSLLLLLLKYLTSKVSVFRYKSRMFTGNLMKFIGIILSNIIEFKTVYNKESIQKKYDELSTANIKYAMKDSIYNGFLSVLYRNATTFGIAIILVFLATSGLGDLKMGEVTFFIYCLNYVSMAIEYFGSAFINKKRLSASLNNLQQISKNISLKDINYLNHQNKNESGYEFKEITIKNLCYKDVLTDISFTILQGQKLLIVGSVGSGKSILLKCIGGIYKCTNGNILIDDFLELNNNYINSSYATDYPIFLNMTIKENICLGQDYNKERMEDVLYNSVLDEEIKERQLELEKPIGIKGQKISGGQRKRLSIARMLYRDSKLYLIDDVTNGLDKETADKLRHRLKSSPKTIIMTSNNIADSVLADKVLILENGIIKYFGDTDELNKKGCYLYEII